MRTQGNIKAKTQIHVGEEKKSNLTLQSKMEDFEGKNVPYIPGNSIRGLLRREICWDFFEKIDYKPSTEREFYFYFVGGALTKATGSVDFGFKREVFEKILPVRMFGTAYKNETIQGKLNVSHAIPKLKDKESYDELLEFVQMTRKDDLKSDAEVREKLDIEENENNDEAQQMIFHTEVIKKGTEFEHSFYIDFADDLDKSILARIISICQENNYVGGMRARGLGKIDIDYDLKATDEEYNEFIESNKQGILDLCEQIKHTLEV